MQELVARGRRFNAAEIEVIKQIVRSDFDDGRSAISRKVCEVLNWRQPNGRLKDRACRDVLRVMEAEGLIELPPPLTPVPPPRTGKGGRQHRRWKVDEFMRLKFTEYRRPTLRMVRHTEHESLWNKLMNRYHYLGYSVIVGRHLKHIAYFDDIPVACLGWGSAAWRVKARDDWIGWDQAARRRNLCKIVNNVRFLILPWVQIRNLASTILAMAERAVLEEWEDYYSVQPCLLETFVDKSRFTGVCYRATNWLCVGQTKGWSKSGNSWRNHQTPKYVFVRTTGDMEALFE